MSQKLNLDAATCSPAADRPGLPRAGDILNGPRATKPKCEHPHHRNIVLIRQIALDRLRPHLREILVIASSPGRISKPGYLQYEPVAIGDLRSKLIQLCHSFPGQPSAART